MHIYSRSLILFGLGFVRVAGLGGWGGGGGVQKVLVAYNSNYFNDIEMKFGGVVKSHII